MYHSFDLIGNNEPDAILAVSSIAFIFNENNVSLQNYAEKFVV
jgi:hypothetical protein